jgi:hypothetical protein
VLEVLDAASLELAEAGDWYEGRVAGLGDRFVDEVQGALAFVAEIRSSEVRGC